MKKQILVIPGDGIGPEVTQWGKAALMHIATTYGHDFTFDEALMGHVAIEATGNPLPDETLEKAKKAMRSSLVRLDMPNTTMIHL